MVNLPKLFVNFHRLEKTNLYSINPIILAKPLNDIQLTGYDTIEVMGAREHNLKNIDVI
ncbi:MAG: hypothetical protein ACJA1O_003566, partial [Spirosomataceae bacterium]